MKKSNHQDCNGYNCEAPISGFGSDWYLYNVKNGKETQIDMGDNSVNGLEGQTADALYFAAHSPYGGVPSSLYVYNLNSRKMSEVTGLPSEKGMQIGFISTSPGSKRAIITILPRNFGIDYSCIVYELNGKEIGEKIIENANFECKSVYWVNDDEFYFDNSIGPDSKMTNSDSSLSGYDTLSSVSKYSFLEKKQQKVLVNNEKEAYRLLGGLPDGSFVVSNESKERNPEYKLEIRNADGGLKTSIDSSREEMILIGPVR